MSRAAAIGVAVFTLLADQLSKVLVRAHVGEFDIITLIPGCLNIIRSANRGIAFGILSDSNSPWTVIALAGIGGVVMLVVLWILWRMR